MLKTTNKHKRYWQERKIDWQTSYLDTWNHPHREIILAALNSFRWYSLWEVGCGPGANLVKILKSLPDRQLGGSDLNADAIALAQKTFAGGKFNVESVEDLLLSDDAVDVVLSDATLIYIGPTKIKKVLHELTRVARNHIVLCEFHSANPFKRWWFRWKTGYNAYNYRKLLEDAGCYNIQMVKIPPEYWPGYPWEKFGYVIIARLA